VFHVSTLTIRDVRMAYGGHDVLQGASAELPQGAHVGLIGPNGGGKSTLLRIIAGLESPTGGTVHRAQGDRLVYVAQEPLLAPGRSVFEDALSARAELLALEQELTAATEFLASAGAEDSDHAHHRYAELETRFERAGGYTFESEAKRVLHGLGLTEAFWPRQAGDLSGGERARLGLARALLQEPDVLLLDEPTNHLDLDALSWLETTLTSRRGTLVVVSHDRYFLDRVARTIWEVRNGVVSVFSGNYSAYEQQRRERDARQAIEYERQQAEIAKTEEFVRRFRAGQRSREARGRQTRLDRLERIAPVQRQAQLRIRAGAVSRSGDLVLRLTEVRVAHPGDTGRPILVGPPELDLSRGDRIAIVGPNGAGKTTLLRTIMGEAPQLAGSVRFGANVTPAFFRQAAEDLDPDVSVLDVLLETTAGMIPEARDRAARFLFRGEDIFKLVRDLSGGERSRLSLARIFFSGANLLVLDEPTNHLDLPSREALESTLAGWPGSLLFVSHDRRFIDAVATRLWLVRDGRIEAFDGNWSAYIDAQAAQPLPPVDVAGRQDAEPRSAIQRERGQGGRPPTREERRLEARVRELERQVGEAEQEVARLHQELEAASAAQDVERVRDLGARYAAAEALLETILGEWESAAQSVAS
jgi:ATP-binding cassette subfamily F protein 3